LSRLRRFAEPQADFSSLHHLLSNPGSLKECDEWLESWDNDASTGKQHGLHAAVLLLEASVLVKARSLLPELMQRCENAPSLCAVFGGGASDIRCAARLLGEAAFLCGRPREAREHFQRALQAAQAISFRPEIALIRLDLAELLLEHPNERDAAIEHLDFAIAELRDMKMQPALERALRHRGLLKA
jgi:tetratricopeptide (TPR) repeat protein